VSEINLNFQCQRRKTQLRKRERHRDILHVASNEITTITRH
jgi:hypothetical protein